MNEIPRPPNPEIDNNLGGYELTAETIKELMASPYQHRFVRTGNQIWVMEADDGDHMKLITKVAGLSEADIAAHLTDAGFMQPVAAVDLLSVAGHSSGLEPYLSKLQQLAARPETVKLVKDIAKDMDPEITIHT